MRHSLSSNTVLITLAVLTMITAIGVGYTSSIWFLRGLWGSQEGMQELGLQITPSVLAVSNEFGLPIQDDLRAFSRVAYLQDGQYEYISAIPSLKKQRESVAALHASGWDTERIGWIIVGSRMKAKESEEAARTMSIGSAFKAQAYAMVHGLSASPLLFFRTSIDGHNPIAIYADNVRKGIVGSVSPKGTAYIPMRTNMEKIKFKQESGLNVSLPSEVLVNKKNDFIDSIHSSIAMQFRFNSTNPTLTNTIPKGQVMYLAAHSSQVAMGVREQGDVFKTNVLGVMNKEQGQRHPRKKAFALPDRTIGYEYVLGTTKAHFASPSASEEVCLPSQEYDETLFFCTEGDAAALASSEEIGKEILRHITAEKAQWNGYIPSTYPVSFHGADDSISFFIGGI